MTDFTWRVAVGGYRWQDSPDGPALVPAGGAWREREYQPLEEFTGLFRTFADADPSPEGFLRFANEYGPLGLAAQPARPEKPPLCDLFRRDIRAEVLEGWRWQHEQLKG